jgi:hypothetical protein
MKIKLVDIDESARDHSIRFGRRVLVRKILLISKHLDTQEIEEIELDVEALENKVRKERHYSSQIGGYLKRIKNGYIVCSTSSLLR